MTSITTMTKEQIIEKLTKADQEYYDNSVINPSLTDQEYDLLVAQYKKLTGESWMSFGSSGTQEHSKPMLSLEKAHTEEEMIKFLETRKWTDNLIIMPKLDGGALSIESKTKILTRGKLVSGVSYGEDITKQAIRIPGVLDSLKTYKGIIRGEVVLPTKNLQEINKTLDDKNKYINCRNACTGIMKNTKDTYLLKYLKFIPYLSITNKPEVIGDYCYKLDKLDYNLIKSWYSKFLEELDFDIDGVVIHCPDLANIPSATKYPIHSLALKFKTDTAETTLIGIEWHAGRTGRVIPVGEFNPVELDGTTVTKCTLHNLDQLKKSNLTIGSRVELFKSGQIIPQVYKVLEVAPGELEIPTTCPECKAPLSVGLVDLACDNNQCPVKLVDGLVFSFNKTNLDVDGTGEEAIKLLIQTAKIANLADVYKAMSDPTVVKTLGLAKHNNISFGSKRANKLRDAVLASTSKPWSLLLRSLGIVGLGHDQASSIAVLYSLDDLLTITTDDLVKIKGIGKNTAEEVVNWIKSNPWVTDLKQWFTTDKETPKALSSGSLSGLSICITGKFSMSRSQIETLLADNGAVISSSLSKQTNILIAGTDAGSKLDKAKKLGIEIKDWSFINQML